MRYKRILTPQPAVAAFLETVSLSQNPQAHFCDNS